MKYKYHDENSPRGFVHLVFDLYGENAARALGGHLPLEPVTVEQYVREFKNSCRSRARHRSTMAARITSSITPK